MRTADDDTADASDPDANYWDADPALRQAVERALPEADWSDSEPRLAAFGRAVAETIAPNSDTIDRHPPALHTYDAHGEVVNEVEYHPAQAENERLVVEHGVVADSFTAPEGRDEPLPFTHHLGMLALLTYADVGLTCPVAMTSGVALVLDTFDDGSLSEFRDRLVARDPDDWIQGAMFMTEKQGGSDVGKNETTAERDADGDWRLTGEKWFCSNIDAGAPLVLARRPDAPEGTEGLSLFLLSQRDSDPDEGVYYRRLKDKLGTKSVPTGELELDGALAHPVGDLDAGFAQMTRMVNLERLANAAAAVGLMGRCLLEARTHAADREAFGRTLDEHPLMARDLVELTVDHEAAVATTFEAGRQFDAFERGVAGTTETSEAAPTTDADRARRLVRLLVPVVKNRTGRLAVDHASYAMEVLGGNGYVDEFVTHRLLRDAQVLPIWEGATNVLALETLRVLAREGAHEPLLADVSARLDAADDPLLADTVAAVAAARDDCRTALGTLATADRDYAQTQAKELVELLYDVTAGSLLVESASTGLADGDARGVLVAREFVDQHLRERPVRGITSENRRPLDHVDAIVDHESVPPADLRESDESPSTPDAADD
ncbi:acyl-CoA dehydrogenase family protein [Salinirubrum litoreum]|uniref:Acyl-CoA dehydrogenase family protein n=1 Tax=Salinirubrum litoreum TaxID=1126234 RepID=A0ABD5RC63_9EURY|nr:acyl-CoA dehydrogenase family protein [Salinirubrum litoreum]